MNTRNSGKKILIAISLAALLCFVVVLTYVIMYYSDNKIPKVKNGILDLTRWDLEKDGSVALDGEWEFYWEEFLQCKDFNKPEVLNKKILVNVPDTWNKYGNGNERFPGFGFATYRVKVIKGNNSLDALKVMTTLTASKLIINGKEYMSSGITGTDAESSVPAKTPALIRFNENSDELEIILHVSNFTEARGGIWEGMQIGTYEQLERADRIQLVKDAFLLGCLFVILFYYLSIFLLRRDSKESLYFSIGCVLLIIKLMVSDSYFIFKLFPNFNYRLSVFLFFISIYWGVFMFLVFIKSLYPGEGSQKAVKIYFTIALIFTLFTMVVPIHIYTAITPAFDIINLAALTYILVILSRAAYKGLFGARIIIWGASLMVLMVVHDILKFSNLIISPFNALTAVGGVILVIVLSIVLAARLAEEHKQLKVFTVKLESMNKLKDEFLTNTSHELRTPVNAMIAIAESIAKDEKAVVGKKEKNDLLHVISSGRRLVSLINDILDYSRLKHGDLVLVKKVFHMDKLVQGVVREFSFVSEGKNIDITFERQEKLSPVYADKYRITQVLYNIIGNAVKFTNNGGKITVSAFSDRDTVYVSVVDTGIGIPEDKISAIFETFQQADASITRNYGGMGLGLSICREIIDAHEREIQVRSRPGEGSEFLFGVPVEKADTYGEVSEMEESNDPYLTNVLIEQKNELAAAGSRKGNIVVVDDNYANLIGVINILRADGYTVKGFTNPREALREVVDNSETAVAVVDMMMPELSGYEVCRKIRERFTLFELPVLMLTANSAIDSMIEGFESGANDFLKKPFDGEELKARVRTLYNLKYATEKAINNETAFLQAQIKPHFLYNTINTIIANCHTDSGQAAAMLLDLSDYLRYLFDFKSEARLIPLDREIEAVKAYLALEKARFMVNLDYKIDMTGYKNVLVPPMIIQPIVENAVCHGLRKIERKGSITIKGRKTEDFYEITIKDNGAGIAENDLERIMCGEKKEGTGTGLANVRKRLAHFYGTDIQIESIYGSGTKITVRIKVKGEENAQGNAG